MIKDIVELMDKKTHSNVTLSWWCYGYQYIKFVFIKSKPNCIIIYPAYWTNMRYVGKITPHQLSISTTNGKEMMSLYNILFRVEDDANKHSFYSAKGMDSRMYCRSSYGYQLFKIDNEEGALYSNMIFDYKGNLTSGIPKRSLTVYEEWYKHMRQRRNSLSRARYHNNKAVERYEEWTGNVGDAPPMDDVFKHTNVDRRTNVINHYGLDKVLSTLDSEVIDKDTINDNYYELISIKIPEPSMPNGWRNGTYLSMINPSTGETHLEGVPNPK